MDIDDLEIKKIKFSAEEIQSAVNKIGKQISIDYQLQDLVLVGVLRGAIHFFSDLTRSISIPITIDAISIGKIPSITNKTGVVRITKELDVDIEGKHVIIVEDIVRTGLTTAYLAQNLEQKNPKSIKVCSLLTNFNQQLIHLPIKYYGFEVSDEWLIGYGMDIKEKGRNIPYIAELYKKQT